jgi:hypothetical protein
MGVAAALIAAGALPKSALALAGPHRFTHGAFDLTVLSDGQLVLPLSIVSPQATTEGLKALMGAAVQPGDMFTSEINVVLARIGSDLILFDTGAAGAFGPIAGQLFESLKAAGVDPADITKVIFTHAHPDHILGAIGADGQPTFANASFHMAENELNFWSPADLASKVPAAVKDMTLGIQAALAVLGDRLVTFKAGVEVLPGIADLSERYGMGFSPLREALNRLQAERLVTAESLRGFRVSARSLAKFEDALNARHIVEIEALRLSIAKGALRAAVWIGIALYLRR